MIARRPYLTAESREAFWLHASLLWDPDRQEIRDPLAACVRRAYLDMCRTLRGFRMFQPSKTPTIDPQPGILGVATETMKAMFQNLKSRTADRDTFDAWHFETWAALRDVFPPADCNFSGFHVGQAQKWINMTFKYAFLLGHRLPDYTSFYDFCHLPIDQRTLVALREFNCPDLGVPWSRVDEYPVYMCFQTWVREAFRSAAPLDVEFAAWLGLDLHELVASA